jgi:hypothetical protein
LAIGACSETALLREEAPHRWMIVVPLLLPIRAKSSIRGDRMPPITAFCREIIYGVRVEKEILKNGRRGCGKSVPMNMGLIAMGTWRNCATAVPK